MKWILYFSTMARFRWWLSLSRTDYEAPQGVAAMAHGGLPTAREYRLLRCLHEEAGAPLTLFGDLDPDELLVFSALCAGLEGTPVHYAGVTSRLIGVARRVLGQEALQRAARPFTRREATLMRFIQARSLIDLDSVLGSPAAGILRAGRRLEIEAIVPPLLRDARGRREVLRSLFVRAESPLSVRPARCSPG